MDAIEELYQLSDSMRQASALLADEDVDENNSSSSKRQTTFLNVVALGNTLNCIPNQLIVKNLGDVEPLEFENPIRMERGKVLS